MNNRLLSFESVKYYFKHELFKEICAVSMMALGIRVFAAPNMIVSGGVSGISSVLFILFGIPIGISGFLMNVPLLIIGWQKLGHRFIIRTLRIVALSSVVTDAVFANIPPYYGEKLLVSLFAGLFLGIGLGIVLRKGDSTGGTDIIVKLLQKRYPHFSLGNLVMAIDVVIVSTAALVYNDIDTILYGAIMIYVSGVVIDRMIAGSDIRKMVLIVTGRQEQVTQTILTDLDRGVTVLHGEGGYTKNSVSVLLCVVENRQVFKLRQLVYNVDERAFVIIANAVETFGKGFKRLSSEY